MNYITNVTENITGVAESVTGTLTDLSSRVGGVFNRGNTGTGTITLTDVEEYDGTADENQNPILVLRLEQGSGVGSVGNVGGQQMSVLKQSENKLSELDVGLAIDQKEEILKLSQSIKDLREMFDDLHDIIQADDEMVDDIDMNVIKAEVSTDKGVMSLTKAANISHAVTIPVTLVVGGLLLGPGAMVVLGVKSAITAGVISAGGALVGGVFGKQVHGMTKSSKEEEFKEKEVKVEGDDLRLEIKRL